VAQPGRAPRSGRGGRRFKSCHSDQHLAKIKILNGTDCGTETPSTYGVPRCPTITLNKDPERSGTHAQASGRRSGARKAAVQVVERWNGRRCGRQRYATTFLPACRGWTCSVQVAGRAGARYPDDRPSPARVARQPCNRPALFVLSRLGTDAGAQWAACGAAGCEVERREPMQIVITHHRVSNANGRDWCGLPPSKGDLVRGHVQKSKAPAERVAPHRLAGWWPAAIRRGC
jgi:hypothetical protein